MKNSTYSDRILGTNLYTCESEDTSLQTKDLNKKIKKWKKKAKNGETSKKKAKKKIKKLKKELKYLNHIIRDRQYQNPQQRSWLQEAIAESLPKVLDLTIELVQKHK